MEEEEEEEERLPREDCNAGDVARTKRLCVGSSIQWLVISRPDFRGNGQLGAKSESPLRSGRMGEIAIVVYGIRGEIVEADRR